MLSLTDFLAQIELSRMSLTRSGQERLEQLAYSKQKTDKKPKTEGRKPLAQPTTTLGPCRPQAIS